MAAGNTTVLLRRASDRIRAAGEVELPRPGIRVACPACGSPDGLGVLPDDHTRWYCHSDRHAGPRSGCAIDYLLAKRLGRMPSQLEAIEEANRVLGVEQKVAMSGDAGHG